METKEQLKEIEDDFNPIEFINERFADEESLLSLDSVINELKQEINHLDKETTSIVTEIKVNFSF